MPVVSAIDNANKSIDLVMYGFTDQEFAKALIAAKANGKNVRVLLQHYPYQAQDENQRIIHALERAKINLMWPDENFKLTHQKTFVIDDNEALVMTFNLTHSAFKRERNFALDVTDPELVHEIQAVYAADWQHKKIAVSQADLIWSPENSREKLLKIIRSAHSEIKMYVEGLTDYQIVGALAKAAKHGVSVLILTSEENKKARGKQFAYLKKGGVEIRESKDYVIHAKVIVIDGKTAVIGSVNMTKASINDNRELAVITRDASVLWDLRKTFDKDWRSAES